ncbi:MAG: hypothetical protein LBE67_00335 [Kocuria palustris]|jgi:hypothetical protein|nr:hypothetical protein [Kocuria palustris]
MDDLPPGSRLAHVRSELAMDSESEESESATPTNADTAKTETEPFPEYDESECEMLASSIAADKRREEAWIHALGKATQRENRMLHVDPNIIPYFQSDPSHRSQVVLEQLRDLLADPQMRPKIRDQFITMINATLQFNLVIFHQSSEFLAPKEIEDAELHLESVLNLVEWMEEDLRDQLETAEQVSYAIEGASLQPTSAYERLCKMASLFAK